jgi:hypothetical protein
LVISDIPDILPPKRGWNKGPDVVEEEKREIPV